MTADQMQAIQAQSITHDPNDLSANTDRPGARWVIFLGQLPGDHKSTSENLKPRKPALSSTDPERNTMDKLFSITITAALMLSGAGAVAAELPTYEIMGFPISPHQFVAVQSTHVQERSPTPTLTLGGMPASPLQILVLTPRSRITEKLAAENLTTGGLSAPQ
jgi:hypothetical protein